MNKCSRAGCTKDAVRIISWRNPKIHDLDRTKNWATCLEHENYLVDYLSTRGFFLGVKDFESDND